MNTPAQIIDDAQTVLAYLQSLEGPDLPQLPPRPGHYVTEDPPLSCTCSATMFGLTWKGLVDPSDNGEGFFTDPASGKPYDTRINTLVGCSLPREVMLSTFGISDAWHDEGIATVWRENAGKVQEYVTKHTPLLVVDSGGHTLQKAPLVDAGPLAGTNNGLDLTYSAAHLLDTQGKALVTYKILVGGEPIPIKGWLFDKRRVGLL